jgi:hypothetical protein
MAQLYLGPTSFSNDPSSWTLIYSDVSNSANWPVISPILNGLGATVSDKGANIVPSNQPVVPWCVSPLNGHFAVCQTIVGLPAPNPLGTGHVINVEDVRLGGGNDTFDAGDPNATVLVSDGPGNDFVQVTKSYYAQVVDGPGSDTFEGSGRTEEEIVASDSAGESVLEDGIANDGAPGEHDNIIGFGKVTTGAGNDTIKVSFPSDAVIQCGGGDDTVTAPAGAFVAPNCEHVTRQ